MHLLFVMLICYKFHVHLSCLHGILNLNWLFYVLFSLKNTKKLPWEYMLLCQSNSTYFAKTVY